LFGTDEECQEAKASLLKRVQVQFYVWFFYALTNKYCLHVHSIAKLC
jgi:hypothetical protein